MELGVHINVFDGIELIPALISSLKKMECISYVIIVYQLISNFGEALNSDEYLILKKLKKSNLHVEFYRYNPNLKLIGGLNELIKRNIGLEMCKKNGATHVLCMDVDEFYDVKEFTNAFNIIKDDNIDTSAVEFYDYLTPTIRLADAHRKNLCPFICKINKDSIYKPSQYHPVCLDPTRKITLAGDKYWIFPKNIISMKHMRYIRKDIAKKFRNSSLNDNPQDRGFNDLNELRCFFKNGTFKNRAIERVEDPFKINIEQTIK